MRPADRPNVAAGAWSSRLKVEQSTWIAAAAPCLGWVGPRTRAAVESVMSSFCRRLAGKPAQLATPAWASAMVWALVAAAGWHSSGTA